MKFLDVVFQILAWFAIVSHPQILTGDDTANPLDAQSHVDLTPLNLQHRSCDEKLGMESGDVADDHISASASLRGISYGKEHARLNGNSAWVTYARPDQWIQINLGKLTNVNGVQTQGQIVARLGFLWVTAYEVAYKAHPRQSSWNSVNEEIGRAPLVFDGNTDASSIVTNMFHEPIQAQIVRIKPVSWLPDKLQIALRLELLGCAFNTNSGCGGPQVLSDPTGSISSMNYPNKYDNNANCRWIITAPRDQTIVLEFDEGFALEASPNNCLLEYVKVIDVVGISEKTMGKFCGTVQPGKFSSTYNQMKVLFMTDHYERDHGFRATYAFVNGSGCGGPQMLRETTGTFQSMNYPANYEDNSDCIWDIYTDPEKLIEIKFTDFQIREGFSNRCTDDSLQILNIGENANEDSSSVSGIFCGRQRPPDFISSSNQLRVLFQSNGIFNDKGFRATYTALPASGCGGKRDLTSATGELQSLNYPKPYATGLRCEWNIIAGENEDIKITFLNFDLEEHSDCIYDYVSIYDGRSQRHLLGKYCNNVIQPLIAHSGVMKILFVSDMYNAEQGFRASYVTIPRTKPVVTSREATTTTTTPPTETEAVTTNTATSTNRRIQTTGNTEENTPKLVPLETITPRTNETTSEDEITTKTDEDENQVPMVVTEETAKWIIVGLASVSGLLVVLVFFGLVLCCRQQCSSNANVSIRGSLKNGNSGVMQNQSYDFSIASTNHSVRSRQAPPEQAPESSQVSDSFSHQGTLHHTPSRESHIYFSIEECCNTQKKREATPVNKNIDPIKVHFKKHQGSRFNNHGSDESATTVQSEEDEEEFYEDDECTINGDSGMEGDCNDVFRTSRCNTMERSLPTYRSIMVNADGPKVMVDNILYESADSMEQKE